MREEEETEKEGRDYYLQDACCPHSQIRETVMSPLGTEKGVRLMNWMLRVLKASQPRLDKTRTWKHGGNMATGDIWPQNPLWPLCKWENSFQVRADPEQRQCLHGWSPEQIDQGLHSNHVAFAKYMGRQGIEEP